jgi:glycine cleavage system H protein
VVTAGDTCGELESTQAVSDLYSPVTGEVVAVNTTVDGDPSVVNRDPFGEGWLFVVRLTGESQLLNPAEYDALVEA